MLAKQYVALPYAPPSFLTRIRSSHASPWTPSKCECSSRVQDAHQAYVDTSRWTISVFNELPQTKPRGFFATGAYIVKRETPLALYKGLGAVLSGIVPKMAIRFASFETYKGWLADKETGKTATRNIFLGACRHLIPLTLTNGVF